MADRGVRVVPEIDVPGHSYAWGIGYPDIVAKCPAYEHNINNIPLNPAKDKTWDVLQGVLLQVASQFPDGMLHVGGDEVVTGCWLEDPTVKAWMQQKG